MNFIGQDFNLISSHSALLNYVEARRVIGITGLLTAGKSTTARALKFLLEPFWNVHILSFSYDVKRIANEFGWDGQKDDKGRKLLQLIGTEVGREYLPDIWIRYLITRATQQLDITAKKKNIIIIDDLRFINEAQWVKDYHAGVIIKVDDVKDGYVRSGVDHASEKGIPSEYIDFEVLNDMNAFSLVRAAHAVLATIGLKTLSVKVGE